MLIRIRIASQFLPSIDIAEWEAAFDALTQSIKLPLTQFLVDSDIFLD